MVVVARIGMTLNNFILASELGKVYEFEIKIDYLTYICKI